MSPEHDDRVASSYPRLYALWNRSTCRRFETGDGWFGLVDRLSAKIEAINMGIESRYRRTRMTLDLVVAGASGWAVGCLISLAEAGTIHHPVLSGIIGLLGMAALFARNRMSPPSFVEAVQVKEEFGTLRFCVVATYDRYYDRVHDLIDEAEKESTKTCESCGKPGKMRKTGRASTSTLCDECHWHRFRC